MHAIAKLESKCMHDHICCHANTLQAGHVHMDDSGQLSTAVFALCVVEL